MVSSCTAFIFTSVWGRGTRQITPRAMGWTYMLYTMDHAGQVRTVGRYRQFSCILVWTLHLHVERQFFAIYISTQLCDNKLWEKREMPVCFMLRWRLLHLKHGKISYPLWNIVLSLGKGGGGEGKIRTKHTSGNLQKLKINKWWLLSFIAEPTEYTHAVQVTLKFITAFFIVLLHTQKNVSTRADGHKFTNCA